jgi:hypothetical protein
MASPQLHVIDLERIAEAAQTSAAALAALHIAPMGPALSIAAEAVITTAPTSARATSDHSDFSRATIDTNFDDVI